MINQIASCYIGIGLIYMAWCFLRKRDEKFMAEVRSQWRDIEVMLDNMPYIAKAIVVMILAFATTAYVVWGALTWPLLIAKKVAKKWHP